MNTRPLSAVDRLVVHHTAGRETTTRDEIDRDHRARGWDGIGYHRLIRREGEVWRREAGRPLEAVGAHAVGRNYRGIGVAVAGNYDVAPPSPAAVAELVSELVALCRLFGRVLEIEGHRDVNATACPGRHLYSLLPEVRARVAAELGTSGAEGSIAPDDACRRRTS